MNKKTKKNGHGKATEDMCANKKRFIEAYPDCGSVGATLKAIGVKARQTFYNWCGDDPKFRAYYEGELLPNRRDELVSLLYKTATGRLGTTVSTTTNYKTLKETTKEEPIVLPPTQLTALFGFLKATDHADKGFDRLIFIDRQQVTGADGGPIEVEHDAKGKLLSLLNRFSSREEKTEFSSES